MADLCEHCNSEHPPEAYATGYFYVNGDLVKIDGEGEALAYGRETGLQVIWDADMAHRVQKHKGDFSEAHIEESIERFGLTEREALIWQYGAQDPTELARVTKRIKESG